MVDRANLGVTDIIQGFYAMELRLTEISVNPEQAITLVMRPSSLQLGGNFG